LASIFRFMRSLLSIVLCLSFICLNAQEYEFGKVSDEEVRMNSYAKDSLAGALFLLKHRESYFNHEAPEGWVLITEVHQRIKILNKEGLSYGAKKVWLLKRGSEKERIGKIKAYVFNDEGGKISKERLKNNGIFESEYSKDWNEVAIAFPNVKVGSVIDITYKTTSPFWKIHDLVIQENIPVQEYYAEISALNLIRFKRLAKGGYDVKSNDYNRGRNISYTYEQNVTKAVTEAAQTANLRIDEFVNEYHFKDIPALRSELYVDNIDNYRYSVSYELEATDWPGNGLKQYSNSWEKVAETIYKSDRYGKQLSGTRFLKDDLENLVGSSTNQLEKMNKIFNFIREKMAWNGEKRRFSDGLKKAYAVNVGNSTEINLILVAMLQQAGLDASPVLVSTRDYGIPLYPTIEGFNYSIAATKINGETYLMDATEKLSAPNLLPTRVLNWVGTMVHADGKSNKVSLYPTKMSQHNILLNINLKSDGSATGEQKNNYTSLEAFNYRKKVHNVVKKAIVEDLISSNNFSGVSNLNYKGMNDLDGSLTEYFELEIETAAETIGDKMYINPLLHLALSKNPFLLDERSYPIDFSYPSLNRKIISIKIPEGYQVESLPEPVSIAMPSGVGSFKYNVSEVQGVLSVRSSFTINKSILPATMYASIKEFYNQRVLKENEKVVLSKI